MPSFPAPWHQQQLRPLTQREFDNISRLAYEKFGLELKGEKRELVSARLGKKVRTLGCRSFQQYYQHVLDDRTGEALIELIDALTTNFTSFMREPSHFDFLCKRHCPGGAPAIACGSGVRRARPAKSPIRSRLPCWMH